MYGRRRLNQSDTSPSFFLFPVRQYQLRRRSTNTAIVRRRLEYKNAARQKEKEKKVANATQNPCIIIIIP